MKRIVLAIVLGLSVVAAAQQTMDELRARLARSTGGDVAKYAVEIAQRDVEQADVEFTAGNNEKAHALIAEAAKLVEQAGNAALQSNKRVKDTEISVRKLERRLEEIHRTVAFEDQDQIEESTKSIGRIRNLLLDRMFGLDVDPKDKKDKK
jgi:flagellin-specific chaperone FliS